MGQENKRGRGGGGNRDRERKGDAARRAAHL